MGHQRRDYPQVRASLGSAQPTLTSTPFTAQLVHCVPPQTGRGNRGRPSSDKSQSSSGMGHAHVYALTQQDTQVSNVMVIGTLFICTHKVRVLFDPGSTHSYVS